MAETQKPSDSHNPVFLFKSGDPEMEAANQSARRSFKYFWRELTWDRRRIVPALQVACVKAAFYDDEELSEDSIVEHMWLSEIDFDGHSIRGVLLNSPNELKKYQEGQAVEIPFGLIGDWLYSFAGKAYGAYTVNLMRARMSEEERDHHDELWGMEFGHPESIELSPHGDALDQPEKDHPMALNMAKSFKDYLDDNPGDINLADEKGWTMLHRQAMAGNLEIVETLLSYSADVEAKTEHGDTALDLAKRMGWSSIVEALEEAGS